jgi:FtsZ-binding cell division protein ZapB
MTSPNDFTIEYKLIVRQTNQTRLRVAEVNEDREYLETKAKRLEAENPNWQVFVVRENYNVS